MSPTDRRVVDQIRSALTARANTDGGWGYYEGDASRLEATCWALLGLRSANALDERATASAAQLVGRWQRVDGLLLEPELGVEDRPNIAFNALAAWLLIQHPELAAQASIDALLGGLTRAKGITLPASTINRQDNALQGWAWIDGEFSWVEPTCWGLIALKAASSAQIASARVTDAERLLIDRCCPTGGWNYGNSNMLGQSLHAYVPTSALGLLAMKDRTDEPCVRRSLGFLKEHRTTERSAMALGLALIALRTFGEDVGDVEAALTSQWHHTGFLANTHLMGLALYSLG
jgi:hypothetical protein